MEHSGSLLARAWKSGRAHWRLHALSVFSLAVAFVCLASALLIVTNLQSLRSRWAHVGRASVYLRDGADPAALDELRNALTQMPSVSAVRYMSPDDARREVVKESGDAMLAALPLQAFSASIEVDFGGSASDGDVAAIASKLKGISMVEGVETYARWSERLAALLRGGVIASALLALIVLCAVVSVVASTMRMAFERRRLEVEVLKLVGATAHYIRAPFVVEGAMEGGAGALGALGLLSVLYWIVRTRVDDKLAALTGVEPTFLPWTLMIGMIALGAVLGAGSTAFSLRQWEAGRDGC